MKILTPLFLFTISLSTNAADYCAIECEKKSAQCLIVRNEMNSFTVKEGFSWLHSRLVDSNEASISAAALQSVFGLNSDPCLRSDTTIDLPDDETIGGIFNTGKNCMVGGGVSLAGFNLRAHIFVPEVLKLNYVIETSQEK